MASASYKSVPENRNKSWKKTSYSIVKFTAEEDLISLLPSSWINTSKTTCKWPPGPADKHVRNGKHPEDKWPSHAVEIIREEIPDFATGKKLERRLAENQTTTDAETPLTSKGRTRLQRFSHKRNRIPSEPFLGSVNARNSSSNDSDSSQSKASSVLSNYQPLPSDSEDTVLNALRVPVPQSIRKSHADTSDKSDEGFAVGAHGSPEENHGVIEGILVGNADIEELKRRQARFERVVLDTLADIKIDVKEILGKCGQLTSSNQESLSQGIPTALPIKTKDDLTEVEEWLCSDVNYEHMVNFCSSFGGDDLGKIVRKILKKVFAPDLAKTINYVGSNDKISFQSLKFHGVVIAATRKNNGQSQASETTIITKIQNWFRNARDLKGGRKARTKNVVLQQQASQSKKGSGTTQVVSEPSESGGGASK